MSLIRQIGISAVLIAVGWLAWTYVERNYFSAEPTVTATGAPTGAEASGGRARSEANRRPGGGPPGGARPAGGQGAGGFQRGQVGVVTAAVEMDASGIEVRAIGTSQAHRAVTLYPEVSGLVEEVAFESGTRVARGDVLLRLSDADQMIARERARMALASATSALQRAEQLALTNNITSVALSNARSLVASAQIDLRAAEIDLAKLSLKAPFAGTVGMTDLVVGELVNSSRAVASLDDMSRVTVAFDIPERATGLIKVGKQLVATAEALPGERFEGAISVVDSRVDPVSRSLKVRASLPNTAEKLKPGMAVTVVLKFAGVARPQVPSLAIQWDRAGPYVWQVTDSSVHRLDVEIVGRRSGSVAVLADLSAGDLVVVEGLQRLREGAKVNVLGVPPLDTISADDPGGGEAGVKPPQRRRPANGAANGAPGASAGDRRPGEDSRPSQGARRQRPPRS